MLTTATAIAGILVKCDPSIKAILVRIDEDNGHAFIIEQIDDEHLLVKSAKNDQLKGLLKDVRPASLTVCFKTSADYYTVPQGCHSRARRKLRG